MFIVDQHRQALRDVERFKRDALVYNEEMCGKRTTSRGFDEATLTKAIGAFVTHGATEDDLEFVKAFSTVHAHSVCCLPKGHSGRCMHKLESLFNKTLANKLKDCFITPGNEGLFFNRAARHFPIQLLRTARLDVGSVDTAFANPLEFSGTGFTTATAYFDWAALITKVKGFVPSEAFKPHLEKYQEHADFLRDYHRVNYRMHIVNDEGYLCDPFTFQTLDIDVWNQGHEIQFAHVLPVSDVSYRTRGLNTIPATRRTNMLQGDLPWTQFIDELKVHIAKH